MQNWKIPVLMPYRITDDARQHLNRSDLCGIDFIKASDRDGADPGHRDLLAMASGTVVYRHAFTGDSYDQLGLFVVLEHDAAGVQVWARYCHNASVDAVAGLPVAVGEMIGAYGNTGLSGGPHLHVDFWIDQSDSEAAKKIGLVPTDRELVREPWPGAPELINVNPTAFLTAVGLDVINNGGR